MTSRDTTGDTSGAAHRRIVATRAGDATRRDKSNMSDWPPEVATSRDATRRAIHPDATAATRRGTNDTPDQPPDVAASRDATRHPYQLRRKPMASIQRKTSKEDCWQAFWLVIAREHADACQREEGANSFTEK